MICEPQDTSTALDSCMHKQICDMTSPNACWYVLSAHTCRHTQSPQYRRQQQHCSEWTPTNADTCSAFGLGQLVLVHAACWNLLLHTRLSNHENTRKYTPSSQYGSTHADSWQNLQKRWDLHIHAQPLILAHTRWYKPTHAGTCQALDTCRNMCTHAQLLIVRTLSQLLIDAERCRKMPDSRHTQHVQTHFQLSICSNACSQTIGPQCVQTHAETCPAQMHADTR
jgi:hypothetical protein